MEAIHKCTCKVCKEGFMDTWEDCFICTDCDNEYAEWLDEKGLVVGEFDAYDHPNYQPDVHKGTKWEMLND